MSAQEIFDRALQAFRHGDMQGGFNIALDGTSIRDDRRRRLEYMRTFDRNTGEWEGEEPWPLGADPTETAQESLARHRREYTEQNQELRLGAVDIVGMHEPTRYYDPPLPLPDDMTDEVALAMEDVPRHIDTASDSDDDYEDGATSDIAYEALTEARRSIRVRLDPNRQLTRQEIRDRERSRLIRRWERAAEKFEYKHAQHVARSPKIFVNFNKQSNLFKEADPQGYQAFLGHVENCHRLTSFPALQDILKTWYPASKMPSAFAEALRQVARYRLAEIGRRFQVYDAYKATAAVYQTVIPPNPDDDIAQIIKHKWYTDREVVRHFNPVKMDRFMRQVNIPPDTNNNAEILHLIRAGFELHKNRIQQHREQVQKGQDLAGLSRDRAAHFFDLWLHSAMRHLPYLKSPDNYQNSLFAFYMECLALVKGITATHNDLVKRYHGEPYVRKQPFEGDLPWRFAQCPCGDHMLRGRQIICPMQSYGVTRNAQISFVNFLRSEFADAYRRMPTSMPNFG